MKMNNKEELIQSLNEIINSEEFEVIDDNDLEVKQIILDLIKE
ncbi:hypothetical protein [Metamycoplasma auris]|nr:hypothetical protein [Metamycoplasma auris]